MDAFVGEIGEESGQCESWVVHGGVGDFAIESCGFSLEFEFEELAMAFIKLTDGEVGDSLALVFDFLGRHVVFENT